jgi:hypothetical protein
VAAVEASTTLLDSTVVLLVDVQQTDPKPRVHQLQRHPLFKETTAAQRTQAILVVAAAEAHQQLGATVARVVAATAATDVPTTSPAPTPITPVAAVAAETTTLLAPEEMVVAAPEALLALRQPQRELLIVAAVVAVAVVLSRAVSVHAAARA